MLVPSCHILKSSPVPNLASELSLKIKLLADASHVTEETPAVSPINSVGDVEFSGTAAGVSSVTWDASANSLIFKDNSYAKFGNGSDLTLYHDGSHSVMQHANVGNLYILANSGQINFEGNSETLAQLIPNAGVKLYYDNSQKIVTTPTGVNVTGVATASDYYIGVGGTSVHTALGTKASTGKAIAMAMIFG